MTALSAARGADASSASTNRWRQIRAAGRLLHPREVRHASQVDGQSLIICGWRPVDGRFYGRGVLKLPTTCGLDVCDWLTTNAGKVDR